MDNFDMRAISFLVFLAAISSLWIPFGLPKVHFKTLNKSISPAGEIDRSFSATQEIVLPSFNKRTSALSSKGMCFGLQFATYARENSGKLQVLWRQGDAAKKWTVDAGKLEDNKFKYFCPSAGIDPSHKFSVKVAGVDGTKGSSPTVWLTADSSAGQIQSGLKSITGKSFSLRIAHLETISPLKIARADHGGFLITWICSLLIGLFALAVSIKPTSKDSRDSLPPSI